MVGTGLYNIGRAALYRKVFQAQTGLVCGYGLWKMGHDHGDGWCSYIDSPDQRAGLSGGGHFFTAEAFYGTGGKRIGVHGTYTVKGLAKHLLPSANERIIPNCPHMGCRLEWNPDEESYDCPCHGSRFDREGHLIDDPAQINCKRRVKVE